MESQDLAVPLGKSHLKRPASHLLRASPITQIEKRFEKQYRTATPYNGFVSSPLFLSNRGWINVFTRHRLRSLIVLLILAAGLYGHPIHLDFLRDGLTGNPLSPLSQRLRVWGFFLRDLVAAGILVFLTQHWGSRLRRAFTLTSQTKEITFALNLALGAQGMSLLALGLGLCGLWNARLFSALVVLGFLKASLSVWRKKSPSEKFPPHLPLPGGIGLALLSLWGLLLLAVSFAHSLLPDVFYDSLVYHLAVPDAWAASHGIVDLPFNLYAHFPFGAECFFSWGTLISGPEAAKALNVAIALALCLASAGWASEKAGPDAGYLTFGLCAGFPVLAYTSWSLHVEPLLALNLLLFLYALSKAFANERGGWLPAAGLLAGALAGIKYSALPWVFGTLAVWVFFRCKPKGRTILASIALACIPSFPWFLKNFVFSGAPFYPFGSSGLPDWSKGSLQNDAHASLPLLLDGRFAWLTDLFPHGGYGLAAVVALAFWALTATRSRVESSDLRFLSSASWVLLAIGIASTHDPRLLLPVFLIFFTWIAMRLGSSSEKPLRELRIAAWIALAGFVFSIPALASISLRQYQSAGFWLGRETRPTYFENNPRTSYLGIAQAWAPVLPLDARVLRVGDARTAYLPFQTVAASVFDDPPLARLARQCADPEAMALGLRRLGVTHLWITCGENSFSGSSQAEAWEMSPEARSRLEKFLRERTRPVARMGEDVLLVLVPPGAVGVGFSGLPWLLPTQGKGENAS